MTLIRQASFGYAMISTLENHFKCPLEFVRVSEGELSENPYLNLPITPYIPIQDDKLILACEQEYKRCFEIVGSDVMSNLPSELITIFRYTNPKDIASFSGTSKGNYYALKVSSEKVNLWAIHMQKLLPAVQLKSQELCGFSSGDQFKILYKRIHDHQLPYIAKFKENKKTVKEITGANGSIELAKKNSKEGEDKEGWAFIQADLNTTVTRLIGSRRRGKIQTKARKGEQGKLIHAIRVLVPNAFNNQTKFEAVLEESKQAKVMQLSS